MTESGKKTVSKIAVEEDGRNQRLDNFLFKWCKGVPKSHVLRIIRSGEVRVNGKRASVSGRLQVGDILRIPPIRLAAPGTGDAGDAGCHIPLPAVYEDDALLVIDKPSGVAVHGGSGVSFGVIEVLRKQRPQAKFLELAHRLDRETSGLLLIGKKRAALTALHEMFREETGRGVDKRYLLLVRGRWMNPRRDVKLPLLKYLANDGERRVRVSPEGKASRTIFRLMARWENFSLLEAELKTGRTHQIRVHCAHLGFPIAGDGKYGDFELNRTLQKTALKRLFLHAWKIRMPHPATGETLALESPLPVTLEKFLERLSAFEQQDYGQTFRPSGL
ncbi:MAG: RluA family pseudouridine synthase [Candidatus Accumulibacter sp.]|jgi:23S rRNA pseudouridine955/2504/2580 synthase|nr:RluA family pseudouridine synthase [Accumulibacter sp.]